MVIEYLTKRPLPTMRQRLTLSGRFILNFLKDPLLMEVSCQSVSIVPEICLKSPIVNWKTAHICISRHAIPSKVA
jgi:hypothetical protein